MTTCRWDAEAGDYLKPDGDPCRTDDYGDPTHHCTARRTCSLHVGPGELTCARCLGRTRVDLAQIVERSALMPAEAIEVGVDSEAASLAGPAADPEAWSWRKVAARQGRAWHVSLVEDDDDLHPYSVLTRWEFMLREDYSEPRPVVGCRATDATMGGKVYVRSVCAEWHGPDCWSLAESATNVASAASFLDRHLGRIAQDPEQDFPLLARELRRCRSHLEAVLRDSRAPERGAPCPTCAERDLFVRLVREYPHYCDDEDCHQIHVVTDELDVWRCPRNPEHWWNPAGYANLIEERRYA